MIRSTITIMRLAVVGRRGSTRDAAGDRIIEGGIITVAAAGDRRCDFRGDYD